MVTYSEALKIIRTECNKIILHTEEVDLLDSINQILAEDVFADVDLPPFDNSAMDGYAVKFSKRNEWNIIGEISAGNYSPLNLSENDAVLITTGSKIPVNADTVLPIEDVEVQGNLLKLKADTFYKEGMNIRPKGNDLRKDQIAVHCFTKIDSKVIAALASCGKDKVKVFCKLRAAILATGDELIPINEIPADDKLRVSNTYSLYTVVKEMNHKPIMLGFIKDDKEIIRKKIIENEKLEVEDFDIENLVETEAARTKSDPDTVRRALMQNKNITDNIMHKKLMDFILDFAITNEVQFDEHGHYHPDGEYHHHDDEELELDHEHEHIH